MSAAKYTPAFPSYVDRKGRRYDLAATTKAGVYAWFIDLHTGESVRLKFSELKPAAPWPTVAEVQS